MPLINKLRESEVPPKAAYFTNQAVTEVVEGIEIYDVRRIASEIWERIKVPAAGMTGSLKLERHLRYGDFVLGVVSLNELAKLLTATKDFIFESNIRQFLRFRSKVNQGIRETLRQHPDKFFYYNNGVTIVAMDFSINNQELEVDQPQIVNGAQTCFAVRDQWDRAGKDLTGTVTIMVIKEPEVGEMDNITRFRNSQNTVWGKDLVALADFHKSIQKQLQMRGFFYEIQAGSFESLSKHDKLKYKGHSTYRQYLPKHHKNRIASKDAIQSFVAGIKQKPTEAYSHLSQFMPNGTKYEEVFTDDLIDDYRLFFYPYLVKEYAKSHLGYGKGGEERKRTATLFFVAVYFTIVISKILEHKGDYTKVELKKLERIFTELPLNTDILQYADVICNNFLTDFHVTEKQKQVVGWANFFKQHAYRDEFKRVIDQKIEDVENQRLVELKLKLTSLLQSSL